MEDATAPVELWGCKGWGRFPKRLTELSEASCHGRERTQTHECRNTGVFRLFSRIDQKAYEEGAAEAGGSRFCRVWAEWVKVRAEGEDGAEEIRTLPSDVSAKNRIQVKLMINTCSFFVLAALSSVTAGSVKDF